MRFLFLTVCLGLAICLPEMGIAQTHFQTIRGRVLEGQTQSPLAGATVMVMADEWQRGTLSDENGYYKVDSVPVGRVSVVFQYMGFEPQARQNLVLSTGAQLEVNAEMVEAVMETETVTITAQTDGQQGNALNEYATVSARGLSIEESNRYAGSFGDPARMASNFAGVASAGDTRNDIVVRGNSPLGLVWRLEGIDIPNPNHFGTQGANGGPISILNSNTLGNSDFYTAAFPAEFGNATAAAFDLRLRNGGTGKHSQAFQIGFNGVELNAEGPFRRGGNASYLATARYSTLGFFELLGVSWGGLVGTPQYQDGSFKLNFPLKNGANVSVFGIGGRSYIDILETKLTDEQWNDPDFVPEYNDIRPRAYMGVAGASLMLPVGTKSYLRVTAAFSGVGRNLSSDTLTTDRRAYWEFRERTRDNVAQLAVQFNHKFSARHSLRVGAFAKHLMLSMEDSTRLFFPQYIGQELDSVAITVPLHDIEAQTQLLQAYANWQWRISAKLTANVGLHAMHLALNSNTSVEPRAGIRWVPHRRHAITAGYGLHSQLQPLAMYFISQPEDPARQPNRNLGFTQSQHAVVGYEVTPVQNFRIKLEAYWQWMANVPITTYASDFSMVNIGAGFGPLPRLTSLENTGTAWNHGVELTVEKFFAKHYYFLVTASVFESQYTAADGREYNTAFNTGYVVNALGGVEFPLGRNRNYALFSDIKLTTSGGGRYTPLDIPATQAALAPVEQPQSAWSEQLPAYFRLDVKVGIRQNFRKWSQELAFSAQNATGQQNLFSRSYSVIRSQYVERYQLGFFPVVQYRVSF